MPESKAYKITKEVEIDNNFRKELCALNERRGTKHYLTALEHCKYMSISLGLLINVKSKDDLKKKLYRLIEQEECTSCYSRDYEFYSGLEENPRHGLVVTGYSKTGTWVQFKAEEVHLIEV